MKFITGILHQERINEGTDADRKGSGAGTNFQQGGQDQPFPAGGLEAL